MMDASAQRPEDGDIDERIGTGVGVAGRRVPLGEGLNHRDPIGQQVDRQSTILQLAQAGL